MDKKLQNETIAEFCGWERENGFCEKTGLDLNGWVLGERLRQSPPNYVKDLNAMHEAEDYVFGESGAKPWELYALYLDTILGQEAIFATAAQRAEAFLRTIGKWED
jgi:hypothetical protein